MMRIYATADIHNQFDRVTQIKEQIELHRPEILVIAGDISSYFRRISIFSELGKLSVKVLIVRGNSDLRKVDKMVEEYENIESLHFNQKEFGGIRFLGVNGTIPLPFYSKICLYETKLFDKLTPWINENTVLVTHAPPRGELDRVLGKFHAGSRLLGQFLRTTQPALCLCGHIHEDPGLSYIGKTAVVNCSIGRTAGGSLIDIDETGISKISML